MRIKAQENNKRVKVNVLKYFKTWKGLIKKRQKIVKAAKFRRLVKDSGYLHVHRIKHEMLDSKHPHRCAPLSVVNKLFGSSQRAHLKPGLAGNLFSGKSQLTWVKRLFIKISIKRLKRTHEKHSTIKTCKRKAEGHTSSQLRGSRWTAEIGGKMGYRWTSEFTTLLTF